MNKRIIWIIVILMSTAVIGVFLLQIDLIRNLMRENETKFEGDVHSALLEVANALKEKEKKDEIISSLSGFQSLYVQQRSVAGLSNKPMMPIDIGNISFSEFKDNPEDYFGQLLLDPGIQAIYQQSIYSDRALEERIDPTALHAFLKKAFDNRGINPQENSDFIYSYGVFSNEKEAFVIEDGHYVISEPQPREVHAEFKNKNLYDPDFKVMLFPQEEVVSGEIRVFFPNRNNIIWSSLWQNFLGLLLFTAIILFSFFFTLNVVFRQKKLSEMKTDFINNMTHEFKTPIATISLAADSINSPVISGNPSKVKRFANIIKQENRRMNSQVEKVLQMALIDKRDFSLKIAPVNLHEVINSAIVNIGLQVEKRDGKAYAELQAETPVVQGDQTHISNIINNLLDNANKYSPENPEISVHTRNVPNGVEVIVKDKGVGMNKEQRKHIFDKFYRVHTGNLHNIKGFGLGLSYVKAMITAHKGQIDVKSELGKGSSFILFFPFQV